MGNIIIEAARVLVIRELRGLNFEKTARDKLGEVLLYVAKGIESGAIEIQDNGFEKYGLIGTVCNIGKSNFLIANISVHDYLQNRTIAEIIAEVTMSVLRMLCSNTDFDVKTGQEILITLKGAN